MNYESINSRKQHVPDNLNPKQDIPIIKAEAACTDNVVITAIREGD